MVQGELVWGGVGSCVTGVGRVGSFSTKRVNDGWLTKERTSHRDDKYRD